jgi:hypothetical protein
VRRTPCVLGVSEHTGWAHVVCVAVLRGSRPAVIERRRITLIEAGLPTMPFEHESRAMTEDAANAMIAQLRRSIAARTLTALTRVAAELAPGHTVVALAIRKPPFARLPAGVAEVWKSDRLLCAADGMRYQSAICRAARKLAIDVHLYRRGDEISRAAEQLGVDAAEVEEFVSRTGRPPGPPPDACCFWSPRAISCRCMRGQALSSRDSPQMTGTVPVSECHAGTVPVTEGQSPDDNACPPTGA